MPVCKTARLQAKTVEICGVWLVAAPVSPAAPTCHLYLADMGLLPGWGRVCSVRCPCSVVGQWQSRGWWTGTSTAPLAKATRLSQDFPGEAECRNRGDLLGARPGMHSQPTWGFTHMGRSHKRGPPKGKTRANLKRTWALNLLPYSLTGPLAEGRRSVAWGRLTTKHTDTGEP